MPRKKPNEKNVGVRLGPDDQALLIELRGRFGASASEILRRGLRSLSASAPSTDAADAVPSEEELLELLAVAARKGNVGAMGQLLRHRRGDDEKPPAMNPILAALGQTAPPPSPPTADELADARRRRSS